MVNALDSRQLTSSVGEGGELSGLDKRLVEYAAMGLSGEDMSAELAGTITPERCIQRVREIVRSHDWLSIVEKQWLLLMDMTELRNILFDRIRDEGGFTEKFDRNGEVTEEVWVAGDPRWSANLIRLLKEFRLMLETTKSEIEKSKGNIRQAHAALMIGALELAFERLAFEIEKQVAEIAALEPPEDSTADFAAGWRAALAASKPLLPDRVWMLTVLEMALPIANAAIEAKVVE